MAQSPAQKRALKKGQLVMKLMRQGKSKTAARAIADRQLGGTPKPRKRARPAPSRSTPKKRKVTTMAKAKRSRAGRKTAARRTTRRRASPAKRKRVKRINVRRGLGASGVSDVVQQLQFGAIGAATAIGSKIAVRAARRAIGWGDDAKGLALEAGAAVGLSLVAGMFVKGAPVVPAGILIGGLMAPAETLLERSGVKPIVDNLGSDSLAFLSSLPSSGSNGVAGYVGRDLAGYVGADTAPLVVYGDD